MKCLTKKFKKQFLAAKTFQARGIPIFAIGINHDFAVNKRELEVKLQGIYR